jgi:hypothetical protein
MSRPSFAAGAFAMFVVSSITAGCILRGLDGLEWQGPEAGSGNAGTDAETDIERADAGSTADAGSADAGLEADAAARYAGGDAGPVAPQDSGSPDAAAGSFAITDPPADGTCAAVCTGAVVRASDDTYTFKGTAAPSLDLHELAWSISLDKAVVASGTIPVSGGAWSVDWDTKNLKDDGAMYVFAITADNGAPPPSTARRSVWVDRVAPELVAGASGYGVAPDSALLEFSEPMDAASVLSRARLNGIPVGGSFGSSDGIHFKFASANELQPYMRCELVVNAGARDRAGNAMGSTSEFFLTPIVRPPRGPLTIGSAGASSPRMAIDPAGRPFVLYATPSRPRLVYWDGVGNWVDFELTATELTGTNPADILITPATEATQSITEIWGLFTSGSSIYFATTKDLKSWTGLPGGAPNALSTTASTSYRPGFGWAPGPGTSPAPAVFFSEGDNAVYRSNWGMWNSSTVLMASYSGGGNAAAGPTAWYLDPLMAGTTQSNTGYSAMAAQAIGRPRLATGVAYMVWPRAVECRPSHCNSPMLLSCSPNPAIAGSWKPPVTLSETFAPQGLPDLAVSPSKIAIAFIASFGGALFFSAQPGDCLAGAPAATEVSFTSASSKTSPSVALGPPNGATMWGAWIEGGVLKIAHE